MRAIQLRLMWCLVLLAFGGCAAGSRPGTTKMGKAWVSQTQRFSLAYPSAWIVESESAQSLVLVPASARSWRPANPADLAKEPRVRLDMGDYVRERLGPEHFPADVDPTSLVAWLEQKTTNGIARGLVKTTIGGRQAFEVVESYDPGCEKVVYWRPESLQSLIRASTGCESPYVDEFDRIISSLQQTK